MSDNCPVCDFEGYERYTGEYQSAGDGILMQMSPAIGWCPRCGFFYSQHVNHTEAEQVADYKAAREEAAA